MRAGASVRRIWARGCWRPTRSRRRWRLPSASTRSTPIVARSRRALRDAALAQAEARGLDAPLVWAAGDGWHPGVVGIVASRLKEHTHRPAIVIGFDGENGKGSGRSVSGVDLGASIQRLAAEGLIEKGGGHRMAAGLSLTRSQLEPAMARLSGASGAAGRGHGRRRRPARRWRVDAPGRDARADRTDRGPQAPSAPRPLPRASPSPPCASA